MDGQDSLDKIGGRKDSSTYACLISDLWKVCVVRQYVLLGFLPCYTFKAKKRLLICGEELLFRFVPFVLLVVHEYDLNLGSLKVFCHFVK